MEWDNGGPHRPLKRSQGTPGDFRPHFEKPVLWLSFYFHFSLFLSPLSLITPVSLFSFQIIRVFISLSFPAFYPIISLITPLLSDLWFPSPLFIPPLEPSLPCSPQAIHENKVFLKRKLSWGTLERSTFLIYSFINFLYK